MNHKNATSRRVSEAQRWPGSKQGVTVIRGSPEGHGDRISISQGMAGVLYLVPPSALSGREGDEHFPEHLIHPRLCVSVFCLPHCPGNPLQQTVAVTPLLRMRKPKLREVRHLAQSSQGTQQESDPQGASRPELPWPTGALYNRPSASA